ncbi:phosphatidylinositol-4-phosphate 5-, putative [Ichthyophthirius multifiliis]|uniref:Phosphatidylinositol-4-phosphate 5-, putative n=1 Tax=Ichthyophthirius multifiliis TaxID=5932 RepID=G0QQL6_ICHMU|nr:phosphatidylinositol-4-phosphate 5-, putative [Ichthyophthirius multifiliis]EGR32483.1 phosphatidylinositol-4-phosphate 5-, putative [Ichthyophthirius multifiliis]|eukprot:XP_004036469.1 phosphatidylinositol-4-phosphate 5-, putative [Ichthyophthirius multifiliis]
MSQIEEKPFTFVNQEGQLTDYINFTGYARAEFPNGDIYEGQYENGVKFGNGTYYHISRKENVPNDVYKGEFQNNKKDGIGILTVNLPQEQKEEYYGEWKNDKMHGEGRYVYQNGDIYSGQWQNGKNMELEYICFLKLK